MFNGFYKDKRVLVTGHTGFKGGWLSLWLKRLEASVLGLSLPAPTHPNLHEVIHSAVFTEETECDIRNRGALAASLKRLRPDVVFHLAAQPIVRRSYLEPIETFETNATGAANLLEAVRLAALNSVVVIVTSDKCYQNREWEFSYRENDPLGGHDVYSMSKAAAELIAHAWRESFFQPNPKLGPVATARAGNVIGGGDYAEDRLVPDCVRALIAGKSIQVRNPAAIRPWQHVLECLGGYLWLAARLGIEGKRSPLAGPFNFGPAPSARQPVRRVVEEVLRAWPEASRPVPDKWVSASNPDAPHEARLLSLSIEKATAQLDWFPCWDFEETIQRTVNWYVQRHVLQNADMLAFSNGQLDDYAASARRKCLRWAVDE